MENGQNYIFVVSGLDADDREMGIYLTAEDVGEIVPAKVETGSSDTFMLSDLEYSAVLSDDRVFRKRCLGERMVVAGVTLSIGRRKGMIGFEDL